MDKFYFSNRDTKALSKYAFLNRWDLIVLVLIFSALFFLGWAATSFSTPYALGEPLVITLDPKMLPFYAFRTVLRMFIALIFSLGFAIGIGALAAKNRRAEQLIIPAVDVLQSVPVLSFLAITITGFIQLFPGSLMGPECAAIFVIFTAQVWNIFFSFYQSLKTLPPDLLEAAQLFHLSAWQRFWKVEVPCSLSGLLWNCMMSMSASWFFVVLSESIAVAHQTIRLPGVGSYIAVAIEQGNLMAVGYAILTMILVIVWYDQLLFRPLMVWAEKFKLDQSTPEQEPSSWFIDLLRRSRIMKYFEWGWGTLKDHFLGISHLHKTQPVLRRLPTQRGQRWKDRGWSMMLWIGTIFAGFSVLDYILTGLGINEIGHVFLLGASTATRVILLIVLSSLLWVPVGVWIGQRTWLANKIQPVIQLIAAFPANLFYPLFVILIVRFHLNHEVWLTPLMILGAQWYILFNVIAGSALIPRDLRLVANNLGVAGWQWWRRLALPAIFPFYITGALTAAGGAWNASIVAEMVSWGDQTLRATGLGEYIQASTAAGDFPRTALGTVVMCLYVLLFNHILWRPLYRLAEERFNYS